MKKLKILAFVAMIFVALAVFTGCDKLKTEDVEAEPAKYVMDGTKLTLSETPLAPVVETQDKIAYELKMKGQGNTAELGVFLDTTEKKGSLDYSTEVDYGDGYTEETAIALYYEDEQVVVESDLLKDICGEKAVGVDLGFTFEEFEKSGIYAYLEKSGAITKSNKAVIKDLFKSEGFSKLISGYTESIQNIAGEQYEFGDVKEETLKIGDKEVKVISVSATLDEKAYADILDKAGAMLASLASLAGEEIDKEELMSSLESGLPEVSGEYKYYLSKKTGALIKLECEMARENSYNYMGMTETEKTEYVFDIVFGADPTKEILPSLSFEQKMKTSYFEQNVKIEAESRIEDGKFIMVGKGISVFDEEKSETELTYVYEDGKFTLSGKDDDGEKYSIKGEIKKGENEFSLKIDLTEAYGDDAELYGTPTEIEFSVVYGKDVPELPKYKDILDYPAEDIEALMEDMGGSSVPGVGDSYGELEAPDEETIRFYLDNYEMLGYESVDDVIGFLRDIYGEDLEIPEEYLNN